MIYANLLFVLISLFKILLIIAIVCLCVGQYGCFRVLPNAPPIAGMYTGCLWIYPIKYWSYKDYTAPHLVWQYLIFVLSLIAGIFLVVLIVAGSILNKLTRVLVSKEIVNGIRAFHIPVFSMTYLSFVMKMIHHDQYDMCMERFCKCTKRLWQECPQNLAQMTLTMCRDALRLCIVTIIDNALRHGMTLNQSMWLLSPTMSLDYHQ